MNYLRKQISYTFILMLASLFGGCSLGDSAGTATATENTFAGVVRYPDDSPVEGAVITLRKAGYSPVAIVQESTQIDITDKNGAYAFTFPEEEVIVQISVIDDEREIWGEIITLDPDDVDTTGIDTITIETVVQPAVELQVVIPETISSAQVWVEGTDIVLLGAAGDTLILIGVPKGERSIKLDYDGSVQTITQEVMPGTVVDFQENTSQPSSSSSSEESSSELVLSSTILISSSETYQSSAAFVPTIDVGTDTLQATISDISVVVPFQVTPIEYNDSVVITIDDPAIVSLEEGEITALSYGTTVAYFEIPQFNVKDSLVIQVKSFLDSRPNTRGETQVYSVVEIGDQLWMKENMNVATDIGSSCYNDSLEYCDIYGGLYNWNTATGGVDGVEDICPEGWSAPTEEQFSELATAISTISGEGYYEDNAWRELAPALMDTVAAWDVSFKRLDAVGFSAVPAGVKQGDTYKGIGFRASWWTSSYETGPRPVASIEGRYWYISVHPDPYEDYELINDQRLLVYHEDIINQKSIRCIYND
ncbi:MAG: hypothetical protein OCD01_06475 [Fibrobacterales bacterium]